MAARRNRQHARARALPKTGDLQAALAQFAAVMDAKQRPGFSNCGRFKEVKPAKFANARAQRGGYTNCLRTAFLAGNRSLFLGS
jgi:hypothetical protein